MCLKHEVYGFLWSDFIENCENLSKISSTCYTQEIKIYVENISSSSKSESLQKVKEIHL